ncbi:hypothetical protein [Cognaticolwellia mytili]|uniref:hypothetical protein n=1 Tax=Cognaticolwellia mytili TaxID=1888913 RepID=UPI000A17110A|nr:hypothetical protein [Cognaticolwellia mytili]
MDVIAELLPPSYTAKAEPSVKDRERQSQREKMLRKELAIVFEPEQKTMETTVKVLPETDRRVGEDRRQQKISRGRWLESRDRNDRRTTESAISVKI